MIQLFRAKYLVWCLLLGAGLILSSATPQNKAKKQSQNNSPKNRPNVLFIAVDDLRTELGCYGAPYIKTPNIDKFSQTGVTFKRAYCQFAVCAPSRASILTGMRPDSTKVWDLFTNFRSTIPSIVALPQYFIQNGYRTGSIGKIYHNNMPDTLSWSEPQIYIDGFPFDPDAVYLTPENLQLVEEKKKRIIASGKQDKYIDVFGKWYIKSVSTEMADTTDDAYFDGRQTDVAIERLKEYKKSDQPFFFGIGYYRPHLPFNSPKKYWDMYNRDSIPLASNQFLPENMPPMAINNMRELLSCEDMVGMPNAFEGHIPEAKQRELIHGYFASVSYMDAQVGRLLQALDDLGMAENTIVVLWSDHGWKLGEHNSWDKQTNFELDTRVPFIVRAPGAKGNGKSSNALVELVDIYPSLCDLAGLKKPADLQGTSFKPLLDNPAQSWKPAAFSQFLRGRFGKKEGEKEYMGYAMRTDRYRYVEWYEWEPKQNYPLALVAKELYDYSTDPGENKNIADAAENKQVVEKLSAQLKAGWKAAKPQKKNLSNK